MYVIMLLPDSKHDLKELEETIKYLEDIGSVPYIKTISCTNKQLNNLLFWWNSNLNFQSRINETKKILGDMNIHQEHNPVTFIFFDDIKGLKLGYAPLKKTEIIDKLVNLTKSNRVLMNNYFYETIEFAELILTNNSLELLKHQDTNKLACGFMTMFNLQYQTFRNSVYSNFSLLELERIIIIDDVGLYSLGLRGYHKIDAVFTGTGKDNSEYEKYMESVIYDNFNNKDTKIEFINLAKENSKSYDKNWKKNLDFIIDKLGINNLTELITNPSYYYYFQGVKLINISSLIQIYINNSDKYLLDLLMMSIEKPYYTKEYMTFDLVNKELTINDEKIKVSHLYDGKMSRPKQNKSRQINKQKELYIKNDLKIIDF